MIFDCHCHIFNKSCTPLWAMTKNRLMELCYGSAFDRQDKDNIGFIIRHLYRYIKEMRTSKKSMAAIVDQLLDTAKIDFCVPLMMNFDHAYVGTRPATPFSGQLEETMRQTLRGQGRILPFYAFDPRSEISEPDPLHRLRTAIEEQGFAGVKLYPPLGYAPCKNEDHQINRALKLLYHYCSYTSRGDIRQSPIPISTHCSWCAGAYSNIPVPGVWNKKYYYRGLASPKYWKAVLEEFPMLKINLSHFGGLGEWEALVLRRSPKRCWIDPICNLIKEYENVYTDVSFLGLPTTKLASRYYELLSSKIQGAEEKVLMGSDWYMSQAQCSLPDYWTAYIKLLSPHLFSMMTADNAIRFLRSAATEKHLPAFFKGHSCSMVSTYPFSLPHKESNSDAQLP